MIVVIKQYMCSNLASCHCRVTCYGILQVIVIVTILLLWYSNLAIVIVLLLWLVTIVLSVVVCQTLCLHRYAI